MDNHRNPYLPSNIYETFNFKKDKTCPITFENGDTLIRTSIIPWNEIPEEKQKNLKKQYIYLENSKIKNIKLIHFINVCITEGVSKLKKCPNTRRYYTQAEENRLKFKYNVNNLKKEDYNKFILDTNKKEKKLNFDNIKTSKNIFKKFMKMEHLVNFYNPYEKIKKYDKTDDEYNWAIRNNDIKMCKEQKIKWIVRKSNTFKTTEFMYDDEKKTFIEAQIKYTIYIPKIDNWHFIIYNMGVGYTYNNNIVFTNLYDCLDELNKYT